MSEKTQQDFVALYTTRPFTPKDGVFRIENKYFILRINLDGMILLHLKKDFLNNIYLEIKCEDSEKMIYTWSYYMTFFNAFYLLLDCHVLKNFNFAYFDISEITTKDVMVVTLNQNEIIQGVSYEKKISYQSTDRGAEIPSNIFDEISRILKTCCEDRNQLHILSDLGKGLSEYKVLNFSTSLVLLWFVIERFITNMWSKYLDEQNKKIDNGKRINSDRKKQLTTHLDIHKKLNFLELTGVLNFEKFLVLDKLRGIRNKITHRSDKFVCKAEHCQKAFIIIKYFFKMEYEIELIFNTSYSFMGVYDRTAR